MVMRKKIIGPIVLGLVALMLDPNVALAQLSSSNYQIDNYQVGSNDANDATSTNYQLEYANDTDLTYGTPASGGDDSDDDNGSRLLSRGYVSTTTQTNTTETVEAPITPDVQPEPYIPYVPTVTAPNNQPPSNIKVPLELPTEPEVETDRVEVSLVEDDLDSETYLKAEFVDGLVVNISVPANTMFSPVTFIITRLPFNSTLYPYDRSLVQADDDIYRIEVRDETGVVMDTFSQPIMFSILNPTQTINKETSIYSLNSNERLWQRLTNYKIGSNVVSFDLVKPSLVSFWLTADDQLMLDAPPIATESENDEVSDQVVPVKENLFFDKPLWFIGTGFFLLLILLMFLFKRYLFD